MTQQFQMKRTQQVSFTQEQADEINEAMCFIEKFGGNVTPNKLIKEATIIRAQQVCKEESL